MPSFKFANIILETNHRSLAFPGLYYKANVPFIQNPDTGDWELKAPGKVDFTTYFNALSVLKLKKYTIARSFHLHLEVKGSPCALAQTTTTPLSYETTVLDENTVQSSGSGEWEELDLELSTEPNTVLVGFELQATGPVAVRNGYYTLELDQEPRRIELALSTTTFKKEPYITRNIDLVKNEILDSSDDIASHFNMYVVDNGRTLDAQALSSDHVTVFPNENVGGAGGFARGMIAALEQSTEATHILLMDDDVEVSPESIKRTYNLLRILKPECYNAFISGAMLSYEKIEDQQEDIGFIDDVIGKCIPVKPRMRMTDLSELVNNETLEIPAEKREKVKGYAAWWYCCIPMETVKRNGLPLPIFVRYDDVEYGIRVKPQFITMNGLGIWHSDFNIRYNAAVERYQTVRNGFIAQYTTEISPSMDVMLKQTEKELYLELKKFNYTDAELMLKGFEDFLRGPEFISQPVAHQLFMDANKEKERLVSFEELVQQARALGIDDFSPFDLRRQEIDSDSSRSRFDRVMDFVTCNFQRTPLKHEGKGYAIIPSNGWSYPAGKIRNEKILITIDWYNKKGSIRVKDITKFNSIVKRYKRDLAYFKNNSERLQEEYAAARKDMTSVEYWKKYLNLA